VNDYYLFAFATLTLFTQRFPAKAWMTGFGNAPGPVIAGAKGRCMPNRNRFALSIIKTAERRFLLLGAVAMSATFTALASVALAARSAFAFRAGAFAVTVHAFAKELFARNASFDIQTARAQSLDAFRAADSGYDKASFLIEHAVELHALLLFSVACRRQNRARADCDAK